MEGERTELPPQLNERPEATGAAPVEEVHALDALSSAAEEHEVLRPDAPRIYVASLSDYNAAILHGEWIAAAQKVDDLGTAVTKMLARSPSDPRAEEFAIHDFEGFGYYRVGEYDSLDWISRVANGIAEHGLAFAAWAERCDRDTDMLEHFEDAYLGEYESQADYATLLLDDLDIEQLIGEHIPESLQPYVNIDAEAFGNDLVLSGDIAVVEQEHGVWVFDGRI